MWCGKHTDKVTVTPEFFTVGFEALEPGLAFMLAFANVVAVDTAVGPVIIDASSFHLADLLLVRPARPCARSRGPRSGSPGGRPRPDRARTTRC